MKERKQFLLDREPINAHDLIKEASIYSNRYACKTLKLTSEAASVLRTFGFIVTETPNWEKES